MARGALGLIGRFCPRSGESFFDIGCAEGLLEVFVGLAQERGSVAGVVHGASALDEENILLGALQALLGSRRDCAFKRSDKGLDVSEQPLVFWSRSARVVCQSSYILENFAPWQDMQLTSLASLRPSCETM
jgi:hypothetical protein